MRTYMELTSLTEVDQLLKSNTLSFLYLSKTNCSVCHALLPKVQGVMEKFPDVSFGHVNVDRVEEIAGRFSIFTVPVLLLFGDGKELMREARFVRMDEFEENMEKIVRLY